MGPRTLSTVVLAVTLATAAATAVRAQDRTEGNPANHKPVKLVADQMLPVSFGQMSGEARLYVLQDWSRPLPAVKRAIVMIHGSERDADLNRKSMIKLFGGGKLPDAETLVILPQFLAEEDVPAHKLPPQTLRWTVDGWAAGSMAKGPAPISSYAVLDVILARLADKQHFPALKQVVVAGHSAGGQMVHRYAIEGKGDGVLVAAGIHVRYVIANSSSYVYFSAERPAGNGFAAFDAKACPEFNRWKYGMENLNTYAKGRGPIALEAAYVGRDVVYLLGTADNDPKHPDLDRGCSAESEGPTRLARGQAYARYMLARHPGLTHPTWLIPNVAHNGAKMFASACGLAALLDKPRCDAK